ncbi:MAG: enoyl-CoA hydratase-related protein [Planctomycetota bacterium]
MPLHLHHLRMDDSDPRWVTVWIDVKDRRFNVLFEAVFLELQSLIGWLHEQSTERVVVLRSGKEKGFVVGADLRRILELKTDAEIQAFLKLGQDVLHAWEALPQKTIACIRGACLGGGLELALACKYRFVSDSDDTQLGLPEAKLGLSPAWGGTQRLVRLLGIEHSVPMLMTGRTIGCFEAMQWGLADGVWSPSVELEHQLEVWLAAQRESNVHPRRIFHREQWLADWLNLHPYSDPFLEQGLEEDQRWMIETRRKIAHSIEVGITQSTEAGEWAERSQFFGMMQRPEVQALLQRFAKS